MKLKNVSFVELHFEKLVAGAAVLLLLFVGYRYMVGQPNAVSIGNQTLAPGEVDTFIVRKAENLKQQIDANDVPKILSDLEIPRYRDEFQQQTQAPVIAEEPLMLALSGRRAILDTSGVDPGERLAYRHPEGYPAPNMYAWGGGLGSVVAEEVMVGEPNDLRQIFDEAALDARAFDMPYISLVALWDTEDVLRSLLGDEDDRQTRRIPQNRLDLFFIADVQVQRQRPRPDGSWARADDADFDEYVELLPVFPRPLLKGPEGGLGFLDLRTIRDDEEVDDGFGFFAPMLRAAENQWRILQPEFPILHFEEWEEPLSPEELDERRQLRGEREELKAELDKIQDRITRWQQNIQNLQNRAAAPQQRRDPTPPRAGAQPRPAPATPSGGSSGTQRQVTQIQERIRKAQEDAQPKVERYNDLAREAGEPTFRFKTDRVSQFTGVPNDIGVGGPDFFGGPGVPGVRDRAPQGRRGPQRGAADSFPGGMMMAPGGFDRNFGAVARGPRNVLAEIEGIGGILAEEEVKIYAHDLRVEPGQKYRYRMRLRVFNPLYQVPDPPEEQQELTETFLMATDWSDWTGTIEAPRLSHYFVDSVNVNTGRAAVEVWKYYRGVWRTERFEVREGFPVGQTRELTTVDPDAARRRTEPVNFFTGAYALDLEELPRIARAPRTFQAVFQDGDQIFERNPAEDRDSEIRKRLQEQKQIQEQLADAVRRVAGRN